MFLIIAAIAFLVWLILILVGHTTQWLVHALLAVAVVCALIHLFGGV